MAAGGDEKEIRRVIEALVDLRLNGERTMREHGARKERGDIIAVKLAGSPWDDKEKRFLLVVEWQDNDLERQLLAKRKAGEKHPVICYPYREEDSEGKTTIRSRRFFDINELDLSTKESALNRYTRLEKLPYNSRVVKSR